MSSHYVYRLYGQEALIYVGYTADGLSSRLRSHERRDWWPDVVRVEIERHATRKAALDAERAAILREAPRENTAIYPTVGGKTPLRSFRIPDDLYAAAQQQAAADGRSLTDVLRQALTDYAEEIDR